MKRIAGIAASLLVTGVVSLAAQAAPARPAARPAAASATVRVRMSQQGTHFTFDPANFTVKVGDVVEFVNVSGGPHNVSFEPAKIPAGAATVLNAAMANRMGNLGGPMLTTVNQTYRVSFVGAPVGTYEYFCLPHKAMGMKGVITVQAAGAARR